MRKTAMLRTLLLVTAVLLVPASRSLAGESLWIEAEHLDGIRGYCWPMGQPNMKVTDGHWGLSGPGWAAEWNQGGESGFLSIATAADDNRAAANKQIEIPVAGRYFVWVRYGDWREQPEPFQIRIEQAGQAMWTGRFGETAVIEEDNEMKLYWDWAFGWGRAETDLLAGSATLTLAVDSTAPQPRQVDVIVLTTDADYRPLIKERPHNPAWDILEGYRAGVPELEPLARRHGAFGLPEEWKLRTFRDRGFLYLWNVSGTGDAADWLGDDPQRVLHPYSLRDPAALTGFKQRYGGQAEIPIFSDPRIVPAFHGAGPAIFKTDPATGELLPEGAQFARWLDAHPERLWGGMMNYAPDVPLGEKGVAAFQKYRDRYVGSIAGESLGYFYVDPAEMQSATAAARTRRELAEAFTPPSLATNAAKYRTIFGRDLDANPFTDVISCLSVGNIVFAPLLSQWGVRTLGYESSSCTSSLLGMRWAFIRGAARQGDHLTATYRSCNFGDSATMFSQAQSYAGPQHILDNYYSVYSGAGMTWYKFDIWYQYMAGSGMFYHEQGFDEYWQPGGTTAAGQKEVQLSPKGKLVDRFLRSTAAEPDRGHPYTPVAFLVDYAHGWEPAPYWPNSFKNYHNNPESFRPGDHEGMLQEYLWTAFHPIGPESERPITGVNEVYLPGVFGDVFDCIFAYPDVSRWRTIDSYPVVIALGEIELTAAEGARLAQYMEQGGTLVTAAAHLTGPGAAALSLPAQGETVEADAYRWLDEPPLHPSPRFRCRPISLAEGDRALAATPAGDVFCSASDRGQGRLIYLSVPHGLSISKLAVPTVPRLLAHLTRGLMPVEVSGDVQWLVNRTAQGWAITLLNPAGQDKPQQGITATDYRENRHVTIHGNVPFSAARDRLLPTETLSVQNNKVELVVPAGGVRIIDLQ